LCKKADQPDISDAGAIDPFTDSKPLEVLPYKGMLNATKSLRKKVMMKIFTLTEEGFSCGWE
jgi:hypothetical protein